MPAKITHYRYTNIQSYDDTAEKVELSTDILNIMKGKSEIGKSLFFKPFFEAVFPGKHKYKDVNDLIRRGCSEGICEYWLDDGSYVKFIFTHNDARYILQEEGQEPVTYWEKELPRDLIDKFGLIVERKNKIIINLYNKENQYPFIYTSTTWNAEVMGKVLKDEDTETAIETMRKWLDELNTEITKCNDRLKYYRIQNAQYDYTDIEDIEKIGQIANSCSNLFDSIEKTLDKSNRLCKEMKDAEQYNIEISNLIEIEECKLLYLSLRDIINYVYVIELNLSMIEQLPDVSEEVHIVSKLKDLYSSLSHINKYLITIEKNMSIVMECITIHKNLSLVGNDIECSINLYNTLGRINKSSLSIEKNLKIYNEDGETEKSLNSITGTIDSLRSLYRNLDSINKFSTIMVNQMNEFGKANKELKETQDELSELIRNTKVCPTCGQELKEDLCKMI